MLQPRNVGAGEGPVPAAGAGPGRSLSARSVVASTLLGMSPPRLATRLLVASGELFGIAEGTTRVALSRMVAAGELVADGDGYRLSGPLLDRQARQSASRHPEREPWDGRWTMAVVEPGPRSAAGRSSLREAMRRLHLAELREGVWLRPDNLPADQPPAASAVVTAQCRSVRVEPLDDAPELAAGLWDLDGWAAGAEELRHELAGLAEPLERGATEPLAAGFVLSAAVLRHLLADPLLPDDLLPATWPGPALRADYERYDRAFKDVWRAWFRSHR